MCSIANLLASIFIFHLRQCQWMWTLNVDDSNSRAVRGDLPKEDRTASSMSTLKPQTSQPRQDLKYAL